MKRYTPVSKCRQTILCPPDSAIITKPCSGEWVCYTASFEGISRALISWRRKPSGTPYPILSVCSGAGRRSSPKSLAKPAHENLEVMDFTRVFRPPYLLQKRSVRYGCACASHQLLQQSILGGSKLNWPACYTYIMRGEVDHEIPDCEVHIRLHQKRPGGPADEGTYPCQQLRVVKGFGEVIICA